MAKNCLVTKLKGVVNNDLLPHLGYAPIYLHASTPGVFNNFKFDRLYGGESGVPNIRISGDGYLVDVNDQNIGKTFDTINNNFISNYQDSSSNLKGIYVGSDAILEIKNNCSDTNVSTISFDDGNLVGKATIDLDSLNNVYTNGIASNVWLVTDKIKGNIIPLWSKCGGTIVVQAKNDGNDITGNINDLDKPIGTVYTVQINNAPNLRGNIENLMNNIAAKSHTGDGIRQTRVYISECPLIKYKGESIGDFFDVTFNVDTDNKTWSEPA